MSVRLSNRLHSQDVSQSSQRVNTTSSLENKSDHNVESGNTQKISYMLLNPIRPESFGVSLEETIEAVEEFGCKVEESKGNLIGSTISYYYIVSNSLDALHNLVTACDMDGSIVEILHWYDQVVQEEVVIKQ